MPGKLLDLPPQGSALCGLLLDTLLRGFDLLGVPPLLRERARAAERRLPLAL